MVDPASTEQFVRMAIDDRSMLLATAFSVDNAAITYLPIPRSGIFGQFEICRRCRSRGRGRPDSDCRCLLNPAGQSIESSIGDEGISALKLLLWAILPTAIMGAAFMLLR